MSAGEFKPSDYERRMNGAVDVLKREFSGLRTGRASTALLDPVIVTAYGAKMPLTQHQGCPFHRAAACLRDETIYTDRKARCTSCEDAWVQCMQWATARYYPNRMLPTPMPSNKMPPKPVPPKSMSPK